VNQKSSMGKKGFSSSQRVNGPKAQNNHVAPQTRLAWAPWLASPAPAGRIVRGAHHAEDTLRPHGRQLAHSPCVHALPVPEGSEARPQAG
jgi:hypothetical protein